MHTQFRVSITSFILIAGVLSGLACTSKESAGAVSPAAPPALPAGADASAQKMPSQAELDAKAKSQIHEANADAELEKLTKEIEDGK